MISLIRTRPAAFSILAAVSCLSLGCSSAAPNRDVRITRGYIYYLDGAGGGSPLSNWSGGVRKGLLDAGYDGAGEMFTWQTGLGVGADQIASADYKRSKARELAPRITDYKTAHPDAPVHLIGLSAGTAIAAYALEALPPQIQVDNVIMLSGSLSSGHDLSHALRRVRNKMYVFTSSRDGVLKFLVPIAGTADRAAGTSRTIGVEGVDIPTQAPADIRFQYRKVVHVSWNEEFARLGHHGGHTDSVKAPFIREVVSPLVMATSATSAARRVHSADMVANPDYERWSRFPAGSWVLMDGYQVIEGERTPVRLKATLLSKRGDQFQIQREWFAPDGSDEPIESRRFIVMATIDAAEHPTTHPEAEKRALPTRVFTVQSMKLQCDGRSITARGSFADWGTDVSGAVFTHRAIPGGIAWVDVRTTIRGSAVRFVGQALDYFVAGM